MCAVCPRSVTPRGGCVGAISAPRGVRPRCFESRTFQPRQQVAGLEGARRRGFFCGMPFIFQTGNGPKPTHSGLTARQSCMYWECWQAFVWKLLDPPRFGVSARRQDLVAGSSGKYASDNNRRMLRGVASSSNTASRKGHVSCRTERLRRWPP